MPIEQILLSLEVENPCATIVLTAVLSLACSSGFRFYQWSQTIFKNRAYFSRILDNPSKLDIGHAFVPVLTYTEHFAETVDIPKTLTKMCHTCSVKIYITSLISRTFSRWWFNTISWIFIQFLHLLLFLDVHCQPETFQMHLVQSRIRNWKQFGGINI